MSYLYSNPRAPREAWWRVAIKWILLLPGSIAVYYFATILNNLGASYYNPEIVYDIARTGGFGGHYIIGPIYIFHTRALSAAAFITFAIWLAPSHKKTVFVVSVGLFVLWAVYLFFFMGFAFNELRKILWEPFIRMIIELIAAGCGIVFGGLAMLEEESRAKNF